jgi:2,4-dienoyl-CoA reductase (NADPH2)
MTPHLGRLSPARLERYVARRAAGGVAMIVLPAGAAIYGHPAYPAAVAARIAGGNADPDGMGVHVGDERHGSFLQSAVTTPLAGLVRAAHSGGAVLVGQIHHPGAERQWDNFQPTVAPSAIRGDATGWVPHALSGREIADLVKAYGETSAAIVAAGADGVELHASHGYLLNRFLSPYYNRRVDGWGGSKSGRLRLVTEVLAEVRHRIGPEPLLGLRLPAGEDIEGGLRAEDVAEIAATIRGPLNYLSISIGNHDGIRDRRPVPAYTAPWITGAPPAVAGARIIRAAAGLPVVVTGRVITTALAEEILASEAADLVGLARALIADPDFAAKSVTGRGDEIDHCVGMNECTLVPFSCPVNPEAGREAAFDRAADPAGGAEPATAVTTTPASGAPSSGAPATGAPSVARRRVVVVGGGPAGVHAATGAAAKGHDVILFDDAEAIGGSVRQLAASPVLAGWAQLVAALQRRLARSSVEYRCGVRAGVEDVLALEPDAVVVATGSRPLTASFDTDGAAVVTGLDVLAGTASPDATTGPVVVIGGAEPHLEPLLVADALRAWGRPIVLLTEHRAVGPDVEPRTLNGMLGHLFRHDLQILPMLRVTGWRDGVVDTEHLFAGVTGQIPATTVVTAMGRTAVDGLAGELPGRLDARVPVYLVGDALAPRRVTHAVLEGARHGAAL